MTDLITRARKEWCEIHNPDGWSHTNVCPTYVVAALLDLRASISTPTMDDPRLSYIEVQIERDDLLAIDAAITRALEGKP